MALFSTLQPPSPSGSNIIDCEIQGGPLWQNGYTWQNIYWGSYYTKPSSSQWMKRLELAVAHLESDSSFSDGLRTYNVGTGKLIKRIAIQQYPYSQLSHDHIAKTLTG